MWDLDFILRHCLISFWRYFFFHLLYSIRSGFSFLWRRLHLDVFFIEANANLHICMGNDWLSFHWLYWYNLLLFFHLLPIFIRITSSNERTEWFCFYFYAKEGERFFFINDRPQFHLVCPNIIMQINQPINEYFIR